MHYHMHCHMLLLYSANLLDLRQLPLVQPTDFT